MVVNYTQVMIHYQDIQNYGMVKTTKATKNFYFANMLTIQDFITRIMPTVAAPASIT